MRYQFYRLRYRDKCHGWGPRTRAIYGIVLKAIKLIPPRPDYDNLFIIYLFLDPGSEFIRILIIAPMQ